MNATKIIIFTLLLCVALLQALTAQHSVQFEYDDAGNRIIRQILVLKLTEADSLLFDSILPYSAETIQTTEMGETDPLIRVYPNPTYGLLNIDMTLLATERSTWYLFDQQGKLTVQGKLNQTSGTINLMHSPAGVYFLLLQYSGGRQCYKLIKH
ncbi:MAG: T9SS type A sorting domain-containing protein [Bacteroidales bacterium]|nr:T9SS type A sorting domain-containing protein [Bacteroidales bacterium]MDY0370633.1 T9SS type A sorting domain-containing protein [Bacteroidales bacterium]